MSQKNNEWYIDKNPYNTIHNLDNIPKGFYIRHKNCPHTNPSVYKNWDPLNPWYYGNIKYCNGCNKKIPNYILFQWKLLGGTIDQHTK